MTPSLHPKSQLWAGVSLLGLAGALAVFGPESAGAEPRTLAPRGLGDDPGTRAETESLRGALHAEIDRGLRELTFPSMPRPYFISGTVTDSDVLQVAASLGAVQMSERRRQRGLGVEVRVGSYELDDSNFMGDGAVQRAALLPIEEDPLSVRRAAWLLIDGAYKDASARLEAKRSIRQGQASSEQRPPSFARVEPVVSLKGGWADLGTETEWAGLARRLSSTFRDFDHVQDSGVLVTGATSRRVLVNSEGSQIADSSHQFAVFAWATTQAKDGMVLRHQVLFVESERAKLPAEPVLQAAVRGVAQALSDLAQAPVVDNYSGPVLFEGTAAGQLVEDLMARQLSGTPPPESTMGDIPDDNPWSSRVGLRVLPKGFSVVDDPGLTKWDGTALLGGYEIDDEGVRAERVELIQNGILRNLLMSRTPSKEFRTPNGHGRYGYSTGAVGWPSNLVVRAAPGLDRKALRVRLRQAARDDGLPYALVVRTLDEPSVSMMISMVQATGPKYDQGSLLRPVLMFKVGLDGSEQLVRGATLDSLETGDLRNIVAAGRTASVYHSVATALRLMTSGAAGATGLSIVAPDLLVDRVEVRKVSGPYAKRPLMPRPAP